jgi:hypothetical protein
MTEYDGLPIKLKLVELDDSKKKSLTEFYAKMHKLWLKEEVKAKRRSQDRDIKKGDINTSIFT